MQSEYRKTAIIVGSNLKSIMEGEIDAIDRSLDKAKINQANQNKEKIKHVLEVIMLLGRQGIALSGHIDYREWQNEGNLRALL